VRESGGFAIAVADDTITAAIDEVARAEGVLLCPEGAATYAALKQGLADGRIRREERAMLFNCATGLKYPLPPSDRTLDRLKPIPFAALGEKATTANRSTIVEHRRAWSWRSKPRLELGVKRIGARKDIAEVRDHDVLGALVPEQRCQGMDVVRRAVQRGHAPGGRRAERGLDAETLLRLGDERVVAAGEAGAHLAERARARLRRDAIEHAARGFALGRAPFGRARRDQVRLRAQDHAVVEHLEAIGGERCARGRDVDDELGGAR